MDVKEFDFVVKGTKNGNRYFIVKIENGNYNVYQQLDESNTDTDVKQIKSILPYLNSLPDEDIIVLLPNETAKAFLLLHNIDILEMNKFRITLNVEENIKGLFHFKLSFSALKRETVSVILWHIQNKYSHVKLVKDDHLLFIFDGKCIHNEIFDSSALLDLLKSISPLQERSECLFINLYDYHEKDPGNHISEEQNIVSEFRYPYKGNDYLVKAELDAENILMVSIFELDDNTLLTANDTGENLLLSFGKRLISEKELISYVTETIKKNEVSLFADLQEIE